MAKLPFTNFTKGEIAPELHARLDTTQYGAGAKKVRNFLIQRYGGLSFRPGFRYVGEANETGQVVKYVPFQFNIEQAYILSFENAQMNLLAGGGFVLEDDLLITAITKASNGKITAAYHGYATGQRIYLSGIVGMTELNGRVVKVVNVIDANNFTINVNTTAYGTFVSASGTARTGAVAPPVYEPPPPTPPLLPPPPTTTTGGGSGGLYTPIPYGDTHYAIRDNTNNEQ